jgi:hypothetical protein
MDFENIEQTPEMAEGTSIDEEIDVLDYPNNDYALSNENILSLLKNMMKLSMRRDLTTPDEAIRLRTQLDNLIKPIKLL